MTQRSTADNIDLVYELNWYYTKMVRNNTWTLYLIIGANS